MDRWINEDINGQSEPKIDKLPRVIFRTVRKTTNYFLLQAWIDE